LYWPRAGKQEAPRTGVALRNDGANGPGRGVGPSIFMMSQSTLNLRALASPMTVSNAIESDNGAGQGRRGILFSKTGAWGPHLTRSTNDGRLGMVIRAGD